MMKIKSLQNAEREGRRRLKNRHQGKMRGRSPRSLKSVLNIRLMKKSLPKLVEKPHLLVSERLLTLPELLCVVVLLCDLGFYLVSFSPAKFRLLQMSRSPPGRHLQILCGYLKFGITCVSSLKLARLTWKALLEKLRLLKTGRNGFKRKTHG